MFMSRSQVGCLLLVLLSISAFHHGVVGARNLKENVEAKEKTQNEKEGADSEDSNGYVANVNRVVPSCPDPIHNSESNGALHDYCLYKTMVKSATSQMKEKS
ncbi:hypothetical protein Peur_027503 [Populus x canadensis]